jgi:hypothetical protein
VNAERNMKSASAPRTDGFVALSVLFPSSASATVHHPKGAFAVFADCPLSNPQVAMCLVAHLTSGEFVLGNRTVPLSKPITL